MGAADRSEGHIAEAKSVAGVLTGIPKTEVQCLEKVSSQTATVGAGPGIIRTHEIQDVHKPLPGFLIGLDLVEEFGQRGIVVIWRGTSKAGRGCGPTSLIGLGNPSEER